jgi:predicted amidohydrolase
MPVRAFENGVWVAAADKWGPEDQTIIYSGRSCVIGPDGQMRVSAPSTGDTVLLYEVTPERVSLVPRRPALYGPLTQPIESLSAVQIENEPIVPSQAAGRVAIVPGESYLDFARTTRRYEALRAQDCDIVVFGGTLGPEGWEVGIGELEASVKAHGGVAVLAVETTGCSLRRSIVAVTPERTYEHLASHGRGAETGESLAPIIPTAAGNLGLLCGDEGFVPEVPRVLALQGADILAWSSFESHPMSERTARCRSDESRVYTAAAWPDGGVICSPDGAVLTAIPAGTGVAMAAATNRAFSRWKERAPGTHVIRDRVPEAYAALTR